jgi:4-carboxymuconolactone decarboxylase
MLIDVLDIPLQHIAAGYRSREIKTRNSALSFLELDRNCIVAEQQCAWDRSLYVVQGAFKFKASSTSLAVQKGQALFIPSNLSHRIEAVEDTHVLDFGNPANDPSDNQQYQSKITSDSEAKLGQEELDRAYHPADVVALQALQSLSPDYFKIIQEFGLGNLWQRPTLSPREKELVVLSTLITQGSTENQLRQHVHTAFKRAVNLEEILECIILLTVYVGVPRTLNAIETVHAAMKERV